MAGETGPKPKEGVPEPVQGDEKELFGAVVESMKKMGEKMPPESLREALGPMFEFMQKAAGTVAAETKETERAGATTKDIIAELPSNLREAVAGEQAGVDREVSKIGKDFAAAVINFAENEKELFAKYPELAKALEKVSEIIAEIKNKEAREKKMPKVELRLDPEGAKFAETIRLALEVNKGERKNLLAEKNEIGNEFSEVYTQISNVIQGDKKLGKLYKKWGDLSMKGKNEDAEKVYAEAEKDTRMQGLGKHEKELNKQLREVNAKLLELDKADARLMERLKALLTGAKVEVALPEGPGAPGGAPGPGEGLPESELSPVISEPPAEAELSPVITEPETLAEEAPQKGEGWEGESMRPAEHEEDEGEEGAPVGAAAKEKMGVRLLAWKKRIGEMLRRKRAKDVAGVYSDAAKDGRVEKTADGAVVGLDGDEVQDLAEAPSAAESSKEKRGKMIAISEAVKSAAGKVWESFRRKGKELPAKTEEQKFRDNFANLSEKLKSYATQDKAFGTLTRLKAELTEPWQDEIFMQETRQRLIDSDVEVRYGMRNLIRGEKDKVSAPLLVSLLDHPDLAGHEQADIIQTLYNIDKDAFLDNFQKIAKLGDKDETNMVFGMIEQIARYDAEVMEAARAADVIVEAEEAEGEEEGMREAA